MKTIIAGSRDLPRDKVEACDIRYIISEWALDNIFITEVVCGGAKGVDTLGAEWAKDHDKPVKLFEADWKTHGKAAGPIRNKQMAEYADACIVFWNGESRGSKNMIQEALNHNLKLFVFTL